MANGKKKFGRPFQKGQSGNPSGRPRVPEDVKFLRSMNRFEFESVLNKYARLTHEEVDSVIKLRKVPMIELVVAQIMQKAFIEGDPRRFEFILDRLMGRPSPADHPYSTSVTEGTGTVSQPVAAPQVKTFDQFCIDAGYFKPFEKQHEMKDFAVGETDPRLLLGARGYGKTDYCTIMGTAYKVYVAFVTGLDMSDHTFLIITKSKSRNSAIINEIADALAKNGVAMGKNTESVIRVEGLIGQDHTFEAITIKSSMRGRHPKGIIMDDPVTDEDTSEAMRALVKKRYDEAYKLCKNICIIGQPAHQHDLYANLRGLIKTMCVPHGTIPDLDVDLEAMQLAGIDKDSIEMSYHLRVPISGSAAFANIQRIDRFPDTDSVAFIDPSDGGDYTAITFITGYFSGMAIYGKVWKKAWYHAMPEILAELKARKAKKLCFETNCTGTQPIEQLRTAVKPLGIGVTGVHSDTNKHAVIMAAGAFAHQIYLSKDSDQTYTKHVTEYEYGAKFDDAPDSLARGLEWIGLIRGKK